MSLREEMHSLVEGIVSAREARAGGPMLLQQQVAAQLQTLHLGRQEATRQQRAALTQGEYERSTQVQAWLGDVAGARQELTHQVQGWIREVSSARQGMARQQRAALTQGECDRSTQVQSWLGDVAGARQGLTQEVQSWLGDVAGDRSAAGIEWQRLAALHGNRAGTSRASAGAEEFSRARDRVFQHLASHPDGLRLTEIEREFGMSRFQSARAMKELVKRGKAEKRDLDYFAV